MDILGQENDAHAPLSQHFQYSIIPQAAYLIGCLGGAKKSKYFLSVSSGKGWALGVGARFLGAAIDGWLGRGQCWRLRGVDLLTQVLYPFHEPGLNGLFCLKNDDSPFAQ